MIVELKDTVYLTAEDKAEFIEECLHIIQYSEELMLDSLVHFCQTGKFLGE